MDVPEPCGKLDEPIRVAIITVSFLLADTLGVRDGGVKPVFREGMSQWNKGGRQRRLRVIAQHDIQHHARDRSCWTRCDVGEDDDRHVPIRQQSQVGIEAWVGTSMTDGGVSSVRAEKPSKANLLLDRPRDKMARAQLHISSALEWSVELGAWARCFPATIPTASPGSSNVVTTC